MPKERRKPAAQRKEFVIRVLVTASQRKILAAAAEAAGLSLSAWMRVEALKSAQAGRSPGAPTQAAPGVS